MEILVLPDGETYGALDGCSIRRVPDGRSNEEVDELIAAGGGEVIVVLEDPRRRARRPREGERRPLRRPGRFWLADINTAPELAADLGLAARDALARFAATSGERRPGGGSG